MPRRDDAWRLVEECAGRRRTLAELFRTDPGRTDRLSVDVAGIAFDFAKTHLDPAIAAALAELADVAGLPDARSALLAGEIVNATERRAATHMAERGSGSGPAVAAAASARDVHRRLVDRIEGDAGVRHILHIGIGGSLLGPALVVDALASPERRQATHFVSNVDGVALERAMAACDPRQTLVVVVSKTFTTAETMTNAKSARDWLAAAGIERPLSRFVAVTAAPLEAEAWGIAPADILAFAETVGGRYSLWSSVGVTAALALGFAAFEELLAGAAAMDAHFAEAEPLGNAPVLAAMADVLYASVLGAETRAVFPYDERLRLLPAYLQQLEMESNGKRVDREGAEMKRATAPVTWGGVGTDAQHAVFQLLHQGTHLVPAEFVMVREAGDRLGADHHRQLLANAIAQGAALMQGRDFETALSAAGGDRALAAARTFPGNRPSTAILIDRLDPRSLGALLAFYEHRTFTVATLLGINPFDQMGVELGKEMAKAALTGDIPGADASTRRLIARALTSE